MIKILLITDKYFKEMGGSYEATSSTAYQLINNNYTVKLIFFDNGISKKKFDLFKIIKKFDIVHFFGCWSPNLIKIFLISKLLKKKFIITPMGALEPWSLNEKKIKKKIALSLYQNKILANSDIIHCTSEDEERNIKILNPNVNTVVIPHGIPQNFFQKKICKFPKKRKALFFSRIHKKKGIFEVIEAWKLLRPKNWEFHIFGPEGDQTFKTIKKFVKENNLSNDIYFHDPVFLKTEKKKIFLDHDILILYSKNENFGFSILEALSNSLPVLTTSNVPWNSIKKYNAGWFINENKEELKKTLKEIFEIKDDLISVKSRNAYVLANKYNWINIMPKMDRMYKKLI